MSSSDKRTSDDVQGEPKADSVDGGGSSSSSSSAQAGARSPDGRKSAASYAYDVTAESNYLTPQARVILRLVNEIREEKKIPFLKSHRGLCKAAESHAAKMAEQIAPFSHENALTRINEAGDFEGCGENLARLDNYALEAVPEGAVGGWIKSPGHYRNMCVPDFNVCGIGIATYFPDKGTSTASGTGRASSSSSMFADEPQQSITFVSFLFAVENLVKNTNFLDRFNAVVTTCGLVGWAVGGPFAGGAIGLMTGTAINHKLGITPKGVGFVVKETVKRELFNSHGMTCTICNTRPAILEDKDACYCELCFRETHPDYANDNDRGSRNFRNLFRDWRKSHQEEVPDQAFHEEPWVLL